MKTIEIDTIYGKLPAFQDDDGSWRIPVNSSIDWARAVLTSEDWRAIEKEGEYNLSTGPVSVGIEEHPDGVDEGGYVLTATFHNVRVYKKDDNMQFWSDDSSIYYDECDGEWTS